MKIGIDARPLQHETQYRGIGKSLEHFLLAAKDHLLAEDKLVFYLDKGLPRPPVLTNFKAAREIWVPTARLGRRRYWRSFLASFKPLSPRKQDVDVVLQYDASFGIPKKVPSVVIFHDLIPYLFRAQEKQRPVKGLRRGKDALARNMYWRKYLRVLASYRAATVIVTISQSSKKDLIKYLKLEPKKVKVVHAAAAVSHTNAKPSTTIKKLASEPFLLYVGGIDIRKNIMGLLGTFFALKPDYPKLILVMVGKEFELEDRLQDLGWFDLMAQFPGYAKDVIIPGFVSADDLNYLYKQAAAFVFPSRYEGFGLPVLEAMALGSPVVAYDNSSIGEVAGKAALLVPDGEPLAPAIKKILDKPALRQELITKGRARAAEFSWEKTSAEIINALRQAAKN